MHEDAIAIEAIKQGDRDRYGELVDRYNRLVYGIAWSRLGNSALCEDAVQETFVQGFRFLGTLRKPESFAAWISRIARNISSRTAGRHRRNLANLRRWQLEQDTAVDGSADDSLSDRPTQELLSDALHKLNDSHRECLILFYLKDKSIREAAVFVGISETAFKARLHRARASLRSQLESQLEPALKGLNPSDDSRIGILAALPASPIGWAGSGLSAGSVASGAKLIGSSLLSKLPFLLYLGLIMHYLAGNFRQGEEFRRKILWYNYSRLILILIPMIVLSAWFFQTGHHRTLYVMLALFMIPSVSQAFLLLRVSPTRFASASLVGNVAMVLAFAGMGFFGASYVWFFVAMLIYNVGLWWARKTLPYRQDYNLFLRAVQGGLGHLPDCSEAVKAVSQEDRKTFARFLGRHLLINDCIQRRSECTCYLPPVASTVVTSFLFLLPRFNGSSTITIGADGTCRAAISKRDERLLALFASEGAASTADLEQQVAERVQTSLGLFLQGDLTAAIAALQAHDDEVVFTRSPHKLRSQKLMFAAGILATLLGVIVFWDVPWPLWQAPDRTVTASDARDALSDWITRQQGPGSEAYSNLSASLNAYRLPPASFWPTADSEALTQMAWTILREPVYPKFAWASGCIEGRGLIIYNLLTGGYASVSDLHEIGLTRDAILTAFDRMGKPDLIISTIPDVNRQAALEQIKDERSGLMRLKPMPVRETEGNRSRSHQKLLRYAYGIWCLKQFGCLDDIDTSGAAELLLSHQVIPDPATATATTDVFVADAAGLFWVSDPMFIYKETWAVLFSLQTLGQLDMIDREACIAGLMRCHIGKGDFTGGFNSYKRGNSDLTQADAYYALESLAILNALDQIPDLDQWSFDDKWCQYRNGKIVAPFVTPAAMEAWARQSQLEAIRTPRGSKE